MVRFSLTGLFLLCVCFLPLKGTVQIFYPSGSAASTLVLTGGDYFVDLNNDSFSDFTFSVGSVGVFLQAEPGNDFCSYQDETPRALNSGNAFLPPFGASGLVSTYFSAATFKFVGMRVAVGSDVYYGWAQIRTEPGLLYFYAYAFNDVPNQPITAGSLVNAEEALFEVPFAVTAAGNTLSIQGAQFAQYAPQLELWDLRGTQLLTKALTEPQQWQPQLPAGVYLAVLRSKGEALLVRRVFLTGT